MKSTKQTTLVITNSKYEEALNNYHKKIADASVEDMVLNMGPQHPSTHGVLRLELITDGEIVKEVIPHIGYLHRCFEKHAESLTYQQTIPFTDRMDYLASMNNSHAFVMGVERMMGIDKDIPKRIEYIRVLVCELNRIASHLIAIGTYGIDIGAFTPFLWCFRDREHIMGMLEWASGSRMLYNYIWVGGLFYDLPVGFEERCRDFVEYFKPKMVELNQLLTDNSCLQVIESGYYDTLGLFRPSNKDRAAIALRWMKALEIDQYARTLLKNIPASAQRLCLLARALIKNPSLLIFDEPCQGMDDHQQLHFKNLIDTICSLSNVTLIYVTHYQHEIPNSVDKVLRLDQGKVVS